MEEKPRIALIMRTVLEGSEFTGLDASVHYAKQYTQALERAGAAVVHVPPPTGDEDPGQFLSYCDGMLLTGGGDIHPFWYHDEVKERLRTVDVAQDEWEIACVNFARSLPIPCFGICRGLEVINVALGGTLIQDLKEEFINEEHDQPDKTHAIRIVEKGALFTAIPQEEVECVCHHHQALENLGAGLTITARAPDGIIEAAETRGGACWIGGVQWHPERTAESDSVQQGLFDAFVGLCLDRVS